MENINNIQNQYRKPAINQISSTNSQKTLGKTAPKAEDLEESVLGALMLEKDAVTAVIDILNPQSFYKEAHQEIYIAINQLFNNAEPIDIRTVVNQLRKNGKLEIVGGANYIAYLTNSVSSAANIEFHARAIVEYAIRRSLIMVSSDIQTKAYDDTIDVLMLLDHSERSLFEVVETNIRKNYTDMRSIMGAAFKELEAKRSQKGGLSGVPSGFLALDRMTQGWQKSELIILAARPGMGKTALLLSALRNASIDYKLPTAIFSLEMSAVQLVNRLISAEAELESEKIKRGSLRDDEWQQLMHKTAKLSNAPLYIDDTPSLSIFELRAKCRRLKAKHDIQLIVIDYLQLMSGDSSKNSKGNREQEIASISRALKGISKELDIPVIAASQLSRAVETRGGDKRPQLSDLRESGAIEQDADMVFFLYRPEYYGILEEDNASLTRGFTEVIIAKHRNGALGTVPLKFIGKYTKFEDITKASFENSEDIIMSKIN